MGGLTGGNTTKTSSTNSSAPAGFQAPYINNQFSQAQNVYNANKAIGPYTGQLYAPVTQNQQNAAQGASNFGAGAGSNLVNSGASGLANLFGNASTYSNNATNMAANGTPGANGTDMNALQGYASGNQTANLVSSPLSGALQSAGVNGANSLSNLQGNFGNIANTAMSNPTAGLAADAGTYMNSAPIQGAINSTNAQIRQTLGIDQAANNASEASAGDLNSSRAGAQQALTAQAAGIATGQADSAIQNNAYNTGLSTAANTYMNGLNTANSATANGASSGLNASLGTANLQNNMGQYNTSTQLGAANSALSSQLGYQGLNANTQLNANQQLGQGIFDAGLGTSNVLNGAGTNMNLAGASGTLAQQNAQSQNAANYQAYQNQTQFPYQNLQSYANLVDNPNYTTTTGTQTSQQQGSPLGAALGIAGLLAAPMTGGASAGLLGGAGGLFGASSLGGMAANGIGSLIGGASGASGLASAAGSGLFA